MTDNWKIKLLDSLITWYSDPKHELGYSATHERCFYHINSNTKCVFGALFPDEVSQKLEALYSGTLLLDIFRDLDETKNKNKLDLAKFLYDYISNHGITKEAFINFMGSLQAKHDNVAEYGYTKKDLLLFLEQTKKDLLVNNIS